MGSHTPVKGKSGDRNPVEPPNICPGAGHRKSLQDILAEFESQTDNHAGVAKSGRRAGFRFRCLMTWGFEALRPYHYRGQQKAALVPCKDRLRGALPRASTRQQNTMRSSSTVFTRGLAGFTKSDRFLDARSAPRRGENRPKAIRVNSCLLYQAPIV